MLTGDALMILAFWSPSPLEMVVIGIVALLLFGKRLPEVGRSLGQTFVQFKRGLSGVQDEIEKAADEVESKEQAKIEKAADKVESQEQAPAKSCEPETEEKSATGK